VLFGFARSFSRKLTCHHDPDSRALYQSFQLTAPSLTIIFKAYSASGLVKQELFSLPRSIAVLTVDGEQIVIARRTLHKQYFPSDSFIGPEGVVEGSTNGIRMFGALWVD